MAAHRRRGVHRQTVAVFGGGVAGLTVAHELAERGFEVTVYERRAWGGKARSTEVPHSATEGRKPLPGEHAYRVEFGAYQNLPDTMRRIPFGSNANGVFDNMVEMPQGGFARAHQHTVLLPITSLDPRPYTPQEIVDTIVAVLVEMQLPPAAALHFANRMVVFFSSCDARRLDEWDKTSWFDFIGASDYGENYRDLLGVLPQFIQASKRDQTCARYIALVFEVFIIYALLGLGTNGPAWRMLNRPTNEAWIDPWISELDRLGVQLRLNEAIVGLSVRDGRVAGATIRTARGTRRIVADWYVCALPVERARRLWSPAVLAADAQLARMSHLGTAWMNGIMFYLRERSNIIDGDLALIDSPWALTVVPQAQFWNVDFATTYGDGLVHDKLSVAIADWTRPGILYGKPASELTPDQVALDTWAQIKEHVNKPGRPAVLTDGMLHSWNIDPGMLHRDGRLVSEDPLVLPTVGTWQYRPDAPTAIANLALAGDYLNGPWEVANMETACYSGRRAANVVLAESGSNAAPAATIAPYRPPEWEPFKRIDEDRYNRGQPNLFDVDATVTQLSSLLGATGQSLASVLP